MKVLNNKKKIFVILSALIIILIAGYYLFVDKHDDSNNIVLNENNKVDEQSNSIITNDDIFVDIKGHVNKPGVYSFKSSENARVNDLITKAGGLMKDADTSVINLSKKLDDEMTIIIYSKNEMKEYLKTQDELNKKLELCENKLKNNACLKEQNDKTIDSKININEASLNEILTLNGIGEAKAKAIIEYREKNKFKSIEDIKNVEGIGESLFASIKENITT